MSISRRSALLGVSAAVAVASVPTMAQADDVVLLARIGQFHVLYRKWRAMWAKQQAHRARIEAMPDCPQPDGTVKGAQAYFAFLDAHDAHRYYDESGRLGEPTGALANAIFETPANTVEGAFEKLKIAHLAIGRWPDDGDEGLEAYQTLDAPWMEIVLADFERLIGGMRP